MPDFGTYQGRPIRQSSLTIRGTGDGLSDALAIAPQNFEPTQIAYVVLEVEMSDTDYKYLKKGDAWNQVQVCKAVRGAFLDPEVAKPVLDDIAVAVDELKDKESGQEKFELELEGERAAGRIEEHNKGLHKRKRKDCPLCSGASDEAVAKADEVAAKRDEKNAGEPAPAPKRPRGRK